MKLNVFKIGVAIFAVIGIISVFVFALMAKNSYDELKVYNESLTTYEKVLNDVLETEEDDAYIASMIVNELTIM